MSPSYRKMLQLLWLNSTPSAEINRTLNVSCFSFRASPGLCAVMDTSTSRFRSGWIYPITISMTFLHPPHQNAELGEGEAHVVTKHSHGFGEQARDLLAALIVPSADAAFVELLLGAQLPVTARLDAFALDADRSGVRGARGAIHNLNQVSRTSCCIFLSHPRGPPAVSIPPQSIPCLRRCQQAPCCSSLMFCFAGRISGVSEKRWVGLHPFSAPICRISCPFHCREQAAQGALLTPPRSVPCLDGHPFLPIASPVPQLSSSTPGLQEYARGPFTRGKNEDFQRKILYGPTPAPS